MILLIVDTYIRLYVCALATTLVRLYVATAPVIEPHSGFTHRP